MGAVVVADPGFEVRASGKRRYAVPLVLLAGWVGLFGYSVAYLTEDMPFRPQGTDAETASAREAAPRGVVVVAAPEVKDPPAEEPGRAAHAAEPVAAPRTTATLAKLAPVQAVTPKATPSADRAPPSADYVGIWGPSPEACGIRSRRRGYLPATITPERAKAGRTICSFHDNHRAGNAWVMAAECSDRGRRWSSQVRLVVDGDRLTWSSSRGTAAYIRCARRPG